MKKSTGEEVVRTDPRCLAVAKEGIQTTHQLARYLSALMSDVVEGNIPPTVANAGVNAAGKLLKTVELQHKYGTPSGNGKKMLDLCVNTEQPQINNDGRTAKIADLERQLADLKNSN